MNCETIDAILDEHRAARLDPADRQAATAHLAGCVRCAQGWAAHDALLGESMGEPPAGLAARVLSRVSEHRAEARAGGRRSIGVAAAAVIAAVAVIGATVWLSGPDTGPDAVVARDVAAPPPAAAPPFVAGRDYEVLSPAAAAPVAADRVPVIEFFMWPCGHCYAFEDELTAWESRHQEHVALTRVPAMFNRAAELQARAFYTAEVLGVAGEIHSAFYEEIHSRGNALDSSAALAELFQRFGVDAATFTAAFTSREVDTRMQRAVALNREYGIVSVPSLVIGGRYSTRTLAVADYLIGEESSRSCAARGPGARAACPSRPPLR